jgi:predicted TIM-barrel fold metal-dependent hydrolase
VHPSLGRDPGSAALPNVFLEILQVQYPSTRTGDEYPFAVGQRTIEAAYRRLGAGKLVWGADMPAPERACSYRQSLDYVRVHCPFLSQREKEQVLGGNAAEILGIRRQAGAAEASSDRAPPLSQVRGEAR